MTMTPSSSTTPYCTAEQLFIFHDPNQVGQMIRNGSDNPPSIADMLNSTTTYGAMLYAFLKAAAGRIEAACFIGRRYSADDLHALTGVSADSLAKLNADIAFWMINQRRQPVSSDPRNVPGALEAVEMLKALRDGESIFSFAEAAQAGLPEVVQAQPAALLTPNAVRQAMRIFPNVQMNNLLGGGN